MCQFLLCSKGTQSYIYISVYKCKKCVHVCIYIHTLFLILSPSFCLCPSEIQYWLLGYFKFPPDIFCPFILQLSFHIH